MAGQDQLKAGIIEKNLCSGCGMCVGLCPYIKTSGDRIKVIHACGLKEGTCYKACPKTFLDVDHLDTLVFGEPRKDHALGVYREIYFARAAGSRARGAQYGGVASGLMAFAVDSGALGGVVLTGGDALEPRPVLARTGAEVLSCAGSKYTAAPTLSALNQAAGSGSGRLGLVGRPCQVEAVRKLQHGGHTDAHGQRAKAVELTLGLFCFWSLSPDFYGYLSGKVGGEEVLRVDIPVEGLTITTPGGVRTFPVDQLREYIKESCHNCLDCTSEWADISVGSTEYDPHFSTLVVRTGAGQRLVERAVAQGVIEIKPYPEERLPILRKAALNKKMRVLSPSGGKKPDYLALSGEYLAELKKQWEVLQP
ncbi:MAG: Coenzyme F420 hydrogenase/dehydrogenase, beta subunit C-terminal domain [Desulfocucumaceae bacterium]